MPPRKPRISVHRVSREDLFAQAAPAATLVGLGSRSLKMEHKLLPPPLAAHILLEGLVGNFTPGWF